MLLNILYLILYNKEEKVVWFQQHQISFLSIAYFFYIFYKDLILNNIVYIIHCIYL